MQALTEWLSKPFNSQGTALGWFLFVGLISVALVLWGQIIKDFREAV